MKLKMLFEYEEKNWELGQINNMRRDKIIRLSQALDVSPLVILGMEDFNEDK